MNHPGSFSIRKARAEDADAIAQFNSAMALETEDRELLPEVIGAGVRRMLADPKAGFYLVAESDGQAIGSLMVTYEWSDWRNGRFWYIQSLYVQRVWRRRGVFRGLYAHLKEIAATDPDVCGFRLYVEKDNANAQRTYLNLGMVLTDYLMMEELKPGIVFTREPR
jgi:GNAT superfamily N-acetyltransferase